MACSVSAEVERPDDLPATFSEVSGGSDLQEGRWWLGLGDAQLAALIDEALSDSLQMEQAWARIEQADAMARQMGAGNWPQVNAEASAGRGRGYDPLGNPATANQYGISVGAAYEVDLWGRIGATSEAAQLDVAAAHEDVQSIAMTLASQVAETWFALVEVRAQLTLLDEQLALNERMLELVQLRFAQGLASALDVNQQQQQVLGTKNQRPMLQARLQTGENALALLVGKPAGSRSFAQVRELPELPALPNVGLPAELVRRRPDVRGAHRRVEAADKRVAAAVADQFPALRLSASTGFQAQSLNELVDRWIWSIGTSLVMPIIDGDRREAEADRQRGVLRERLAAYGASVLSAFGEVEDALVRERYQREFLVQLDAQLDVSRKTLELAQDRYVQGLSDYLPVLTALSAVQHSEIAVITARRQLVSYRIQLCRALGGSWTETLEDEGGQ
jgi:NodT family efflux transporter outer membrane factor (OMF) lipoprotein